MPFHEPDVEGEFCDEITHCEVCGEDVFTFEQAEAHSKAYAAAVARARNAPEPARLFELRVSLGWSQSKMEEAFGVGPKTWGRWERGTVPPSGPAARLMWIAENERAVFLRMVDAHSKQPLRLMKVSGSIVPQGPGEPAAAFRTAKPVARREGHAGNSSIGSNGNGGPV